jgi:hypothetical protein
VVTADVRLAGWRLEIGEDRVRVPALDLEGHPQRLSPEDYAAIGVLLQTAADTQAVSPSAPPYDNLQPLRLPSLAALPSRSASSAASISSAWAGSNAASPSS